MRHFNSQPHEEADWCITVQKLGQNYFNSQPHEEADSEAAKKSVMADIISTHSLTKRLTNYVVTEKEILRNFNSQPHEEADLPGLREIR